MGGDVTLSKKKIATKTKRKKKGKMTETPISQSTQQLPCASTSEERIETSKPKLKRPSTAPVGGRRRTSLYRTEEESSQKSLLSGMSSSFASDVPRLIDFHRYVPSPFSSSSSVGKTLVNEKGKGEDALLSVGNLPELSLGRPSLPMIDYEVRRNIDLGEGVRSKVVGG